MRLTCLILFGLTATVTAAEPFQQDAGPDGIVCVEAEHYDNKVDIGTQHLVARNNRGRIHRTRGIQRRPGHADPAGHAPGRQIGHHRLRRRTARIWISRSDFVKTGTYYFSILAFGRDGNSDSAHIGLDGKAFDTCDNLSGWNAQYRWSRHHDGRPRRHL